MLGFGVLGQFALGQVGGPQAADATAAGDTVVLNLSLIAGQASGQVETKPQPGAGGIAGGRKRRRRRPARVSGQVIELTVEIIAGRASGLSAPVISDVSRENINAQAPGDEIIVAIGSTRIVSGKAKGFDAIADDNNFLLLLSAA